MRSNPGVIFQFCGALLLVAGALGPGQLHAQVVAEPQLNVESAWVVADSEGASERLAMEPGPGITAERLYTLRFHYEGLQPAAGLRIVHELPANERYVAGSATGPGAEISYSVDGGRSFAAPDALSNPTNYTHIRWILPGAHPPGTAGLVSYRARPHDVAADTTAELE